MSSVNSDGPTTAGGEGGVGGVNQSFVDTRADLLLRKRLTANS